MRSNLLVTRREIFSSSASNTCTSLGCIAGFTSLHGASTSAPGPAVSTSSGCSWRSAARFAVSMARGEGWYGERGAFSGRHATLARSHNAPPGGDALD